MIVFLIGITALALWRLRFVRENGSYLDRTSTSSIKGLFILLVFLRHVYPYVIQEGGAFGDLGKLDAGFFIIDVFLAQLIVVMFLFYSGYGVMESIRNKGSGYVRDMPKKRLLATLLNFDVAVVVFLIVDCSLGRFPGWDEAGLALLSWSSVGNSNWYIFTILMCYAISWIFALCMQGRVARWINDEVLAWMILLGVIVVGIGLAFVRPLQYYNTIAAYGVGTLYSVYRERIEHWLSVNRKNWCIALCTGLALWFGVHFMTDPSSGFWFNVKGVGFAAVVVLMTMKIRFGNRVLNCFGENLFPLYIYQRLPMMVLMAIAPSFFCTHYIIYILVCFALTCLMAGVYRFVKIKL